MSIGDVRVIADKDYVDTSVVQYISKDDVLDDILENKLVVITDDESGVKQLLFKDKSKIRSGKTYAVLIEEVVAGNPVDTGEVDSEGNPIMEVPTLAGLGINGVSGGTNDSGSNSLIPTEDTAAPIISCNSTATAGTGVVVTISNYDNTKTYTFDKSGGSVSIVSSSGTFIWTMPIVSTNETHTIKVQASDNGSNPSTYSNVASVLVSNLLTLADDSMIFENATIVEDNFESIGGSLEGNTINAGTTIPALSALPESTNSSLVVGSEIVEGQRVQVYYDSGDVERVIGTVSANDGTINTHDIFGDGSAVATYQLDGNADDLGGNYNGTATNVTYADGKFGQAIKANNIANNSGGSRFNTGIPFNEETEIKTISFWHKQAIKSSNNYGTLFSTFGTPVWSGFWLRVNDKGNLYLSSSYYNSTSNSVTSSIDVTDGIWRHIVVQVGSDTLKIYVNGSLEDKSTLAGSISTSNENIRILYGGSNGSWENGSEAVIDQVRIFNRALTQEEVTTLYNENVAKYTTPMTLPSKPTKIVTKDNIFESITFNHPLGYNWATNDVKLTLNKPRLNVLDESTNTSLVTFNRISNGDKLSLLPEGGLETIDFPIGSVSTEGFKAFSIVTYTSNGTSQDIETGINSVDFTVANNGSGYWLDRSVNQVKNDAGTVVSSGTCDWDSAKGVSKVHIKCRDSDWYHQVYDGLRGATKSIYTNSTLAEGKPADYLTGFTSSGFSVDFTANGSTHKFVAYQTLYTHVKWGTTNQGKFYIEAYNPVTKEGMIYYVGSGTAGHEIPHSMGVAPDFMMIKALGLSQHWMTFRQTNEDSYMHTSLNTPETNSDDHTINFNTGTFNIAGSSNYNNSTTGVMMAYYKCKSETFTIGTYTGTGTSGNFIETLDVNGVARKPRRVIIRRIDSAGGWLVLDGERGDFTNYIYLNAINAEGSYQGISSLQNGFTLLSAGQEVNASGGQYLYLVEFETDLVTYTTDISHLNLSEAPTIIFKDPLPKLETSVVADGEDKNFEVREVDAVAVDGSTVTIDYSTKYQIGDTGSFRITSDDDTISKLNIDLTREG
jgi:hypothetical protein